MVPPREHPVPTGLLPGERMAAAPISALQLGGAGDGTAAGTRCAGRLFVTTFRLVWEASSTAAAGAAASPGDDPPLSWPLVSLPLYSIDRFTKYHQTARSNGRGGIEPPPPPAADPEIVVEVYPKYGALPALRVLVAAAAFGRFSVVVHESRAPGFERIFAASHAAALAGKGGGERGGAAGGERSLDAEDRSLDSD